VPFVADDLGAWLIGVLADAGRKKLTTLILGTPQQRALRSAATAAVQRTADELRSDDEEQAGHVALVISQVFSEPVPGESLAGHETVLEALQAGIAGQLAVLDDASLTETGQSSSDVLEVPGTVLAEKLTAHLLREIVSRGARGGPLEPLANQLNHDVTQGMVGRLGDKVREALARLDTAHAVATAPTALAQLPPSVAGFTGRDDELAVLAELLDPARAAGPVVVSAVAGLAGVGKTTLAVEAGHAALGRGWFGGGVLFMDLHGYNEAPVKPSQALDALLRALGVPTEHIPPGAEERAGLYRSVLAQFSEPVLVIADNVSSEAQVKPLLPGTGTHKVLVTSRHTLAGLGARLVDMTVLDEEAAVGLLAAALQTARPEDDRISGDREAAGLLAGVCGGLPLALQITAALLKVDPGLSAAELADQLSDETERLAALRYDDGSGIAAPSVAAAFGLSYARLDNTTAQMFRLLAVCPGPDVCTPAAAALADMPASQARTVLATLARAHLIEPAPGKTGRWQMHDLVHLYASELSGTHAEPDGREQARDRLLGYYLDMTGAADAQLRTLPGMEVRGVFADRDDALAWLDAERANLIPAVRMAADTGRDEAAMRLPLVLAIYLDWRRRFDDSIATASISLSTARHLGDRRGEGAALTILGNALLEVRRFEEAITAYHDAAAIFRETGGRPDQSAALNNLGNSLREVRRFDEAITAHQEGLAICRDIGDRHSEGMALNNLGAALRQVRRFKEAVTAHRDAAAIYRETGDRHSEGSALNNLGNALQELRRFEEAITAHQNAAAIYRDTGDRHSEGNALTNLGLALTEMRRFEDAITVHQDAAAIYRDTGDNHHMGIALTNLGLALTEMRRFEDAITALQDAAGVFGETGDRHGEGIAQGNLGATLQRADRFEDAITALQDAAAIYRETSDRHSEGMALEGLGLALVEVRQFAEAITAYQAALAIYRETGDQHREGIALNNLQTAQAAQQA
jgi:tetratricopeptide (TPR) repeat protein